MSEDRFVVSMESLLTRSKLNRRVIDTKYGGRVVCYCTGDDDAKMIAKALNKIEAQDG